MARVLDYCEVLNFSLSEMGSHRKILSRKETGSMFQKAVLNAVQGEHWRGKTRSREVGEGVPAVAQVMGSRAVDQDGSGGEQQCNYIHT